jgi:uncharacterized iron-regulated membrane protein
MSVWQRWLHHPESLWLRKAFFHLHVWVGFGAGAYILFMSISGSLIVFRNQLDKTLLAPIVESLVKVHGNQSLGLAGRFVNGIGAVSLISLCLTGIVIWWPGLAHWRRALKVDWKSHFARVIFDLHSALGFWCLFFLLIWAISGFYFSFPDPINALFGAFDPADKFTDKVLYALSLMHFGRFDWFSEALWALFGLAPAVLAFTGIFICCHRAITGLHQGHAANPEQFHRDIGA